MKSAWILYLITILNLIVLSGQDGEHVEIPRGVFNVIEISTVVAVYLKVSYGRYGKKLLAKENLRSRLVLREKAEVLLNDQPSN